MPMRLSYSLRMGRFQSEIEYQYVFIGDDAINNVLSFTRQPATVDVNTNNNYNNNTFY